MQKIKKNRGSTILFLIGVFLIPFYNDAPFEISFLRSPSRLLFILSFFVFMFEQISFRRTKLSVSIQEVLLLSALCFFSVCSFLFNINSSGLINGDGVTGINQMISATISILVLFICSIYYKHVFLNIDPKHFCKAIQLAFIFMFFYILLEIYFYVLPIEHSSRSLMFWLEDAFHHRQRVLSNPMHRIRGFAFEPSYLVPVLFFMLPFLINRRFLLTAWCLSAFLTFSPTAYLAAIVFYIVYKVPKNIVMVMLLFLIVVCICMYYFIASGEVNIPWSLMNSASIRIGSWVSGIDLISKNVLFGVGPGMSGYWIVFQFPDFFYTSPEAAGWYSLGINHFSASAFSSLLTLITSTGIFPLFSIVCYFFFRKKQYNSKQRIVEASLVSLIISSFGVSDIQFAGFWLFFSISLAGKWEDLLSEKEKSKN